MFGLFRRKKTYPAYVDIPIPEGCREMTEYEKRFVVNGGSERRENSHEGVASANVGDTIQRNDGTVVTLNQGDIDYAKAQLGSSDSGSGTSVSGSVGGSGSNGNTPSSPSSPSSPYSPSSPSSPSSLSSTNKTTDATANILKGSDHHSAYDQQYINEMMEKEQKKALSGSRIQGNAVSGKRIESHPAKNIKNTFAREFLASLYAGNNAGYLIDHEYKLIKTNWNDKKALNEAKYMIQNYEPLEAGYKLVAYDEKKDSFLQFRNFSDVEHYQTFEKLGVYENNPNGTDVYFIYTYTEDDRGMKEFERSSIIDDIKHLQKNGFNVRVIENGTKEELLKAFSDDNAKMIVTSGHGSEYGYICTSDYNKLYPSDVQKLEAGESLNTVVFEHCHQGNIEKQWESAFGGSIDVVGWHDTTSTLETRLFNGCGAFDRQDLNLRDYLNSSLFGEFSAGRNF